VDIKASEEGKLTRNASFEFGVHIFTFFNILKKIVPSSELCP
jgi:hypothetical protein